MGPLAPILDSLLKEFKTGIKEKRSTLEGLWPQIVGDSLSRHTQARLLKTGVLCVWVDDSTLASELSQKHQGTFLKRAQAVLGEGAVKRIIFRVGQIRSSQ